MKRPSSGTGRVESTEAIRAALAGKTQRELCDMIVSLRCLEPLFTAPQIAAREGMNVRDVRKAMRSGEMVHPVWGPGYICRGTNSKKVTASQVNAWRQSFFVSVSPAPNSRRYSCCSS